MADKTVNVRGSVLLSPEEVLDAVNAETKMLAEEMYRHDPAEGMAFQIAVEAVVASALGRLTDGVSTH
jgi:hypothetical protein